MTEQLPMDLPGELPLHGSEDSAGPAAPGEVEQDSDWAARCRLRLRAALEVLAEQSEPMTPQSLKQAAEQRVPLTPYDASTTKSGGQRSDNNLFWNLTTTYEHAGWLHATPFGYRLTKQGRAALDSGTPAQALYDLGLLGYKGWDAARKEPLPDLPQDPATEILHPGSAAAHAFRACEPLLNAWQSGDSAFAPGTEVWSPVATTELAHYLRDAPLLVPGELPGLLSSPARLLAAESMGLLLAPLSDMIGSTKRARVRTPLLLAPDPLQFPGRSRPIWSTVSSGPVRP